MLDAEPTVRATVIRERLRPLGYRGGITHPQGPPRAGAAAGSSPPARSSARATSPGEIGQVDWWHTGAQVPVGRGRAPRGVRSGDHAALVGCPCRGVHPGPDRRRPAALAARLPRAPGRRARRARVRQRRLGRRLARGRPGTAPSRGHRAAGRAARQAHRAAPRRPTSKGSVERTIGYLETSFLPLRTSPRSRTSRPSTTRWATDVAGRAPPAARPARPWRVAGRSSGAILGPLPEPAARHRPPPRGPGGQGLAAGARPCRLLGAARLCRPPMVAARVTPTTVHLSCEGTEIAVHRRSFVPADVVLDPAHGRAVRLAREARDRLAWRRRRAARRRPRPLRRALGGAGMTAPGGIGARLPRPGPQGTAHQGRVRPPRRAGPGRGLGPRDLPRRGARRGGERPGQPRRLGARQGGPLPGRQDPRRLRLHPPDPRSTARSSPTSRSSTSSPRPPTSCSWDRPGTGKTHLSIALAVQAARRGHRVAFATAHQWVNRLGAAKRAGRLDEELERLGRVPLLVVDEVGYIPFDPEAASLFFALVSSRYERRSLIVSLQQDLQRLGRDLRRPGGGRGHGRPARPPRRGHRPQGRQLPPAGQAGGGAQRAQAALTCSGFDRRFLLRFGPALTCHHPPRTAALTAGRLHASRGAAARREAQTGSGHACSLAARAGSLRSRASRGR